MSWWCGFAETEVKMEGVEETGPVSAPAEAGSGPENADQVIIWLAFHLPQLSCEHTDASMRFVQRRSRGIRSLRPEYLTKTIVHVHLYEKVSDVKRYCVAASRPSLYHP